MVLPFHRQPLLHKRYANLDLPVNEKVSKSPVQETDVKGDEYANFLKSLSNGDRQDDTVTKPKISTQPISSGKANQTKAPSLFLRPGSSKTDGLLHVTLRAQQNEKDHRKRMRVVEDVMLQHKQEERELKRSEGDIIKKQQHLRRIMLDYENNIYKKKRGEEKKLSDNNTEIEKIKQQHAIQEDRSTKVRIERNLSAGLKMRDKERKSFLFLTSTEFDYYKVAKQLELTRNEVKRLTTEYEANLKRKEEEEFKLKKKMAELSIGVNMEAQKKRTLQVEEQNYDKDTAKKDVYDERRRKGNLEERIKHTENQGLRHEFTKRKLSRDLYANKESLSLKNREEGRKMTDVNRRLQHNSTSQRQAKLAAEYLELDRQGKEIEERGQFAEARRSQLLEQATRDKKHQYNQNIAEWKKRYLDKENEAKRKCHEDGIKHLQKIVSKLEESEHALYNRLRAAEMQRRKQEQVVTRMMNDLGSLKRENAKKIKDAMVQCQKKEVEIEQKLLRERAELDKLHSQREETIKMLNHQRSCLQEDKYLLNEEEREHNRIARIGQRTDDIEQEARS
ncbi:splicing regulatory glutamine/lysine-rich protein 1-like [Actinia tenebrosa]|uniref:Splicing regulatory glutamine/lysine-rich protein 1-like n=1 Tax=Actinia tenebrosa TaxID=6105 RepID=A0A6P8HUP3_ACTTE|nr:splicing regulatory glutamine/lysine-rich protein 1-like [Actinia tenebrosa]